MRSSGEPKHRRLVAAKTIILASAFAGACATLAAPAPKDLVSNCAPHRLDDERMFARLELRFSKSKSKAPRYTSRETLYSDPACEISILETKTEGRWKLSKSEILSLFPARILVRPLDPRVADAWNDRRVCRQQWLNGEQNDITRTDCARAKTARYYLMHGNRGRIFLHECDPRAGTDSRCVAYTFGGDSESAFKTPVNYRN
jgi:hypothetical protein